MKAISQFVVRLVELVEAEAKAAGGVLRVEARRAHSLVCETAMAATFLVVAAPLMLAGASLLAAGLYWWVEPTWGRAVSAAVVGLVLVGAAAGCMLCFSRCSEGRSR